MSLVLQVFDNALAWIKGAQPIDVALTLLCCTAVVLCSIVFAARRLRPTRLAERRLVGRPISVSWRDGVGFHQSDEGLCQDISAGGMGLDLPFPFKVGARVNLRVAEGKLLFGAVVRRCRPIGSRYAVGVQFDSHAGAPGQLL